MLDRPFEPAEAEARISALWDQANAFAAGAAKRREDTYCIVIPPPNVTGNLHMGHAFNNTLQDILVRWHRMRGFDTLWQPGTDHAGIATQMVVERELGKSNRRRTDMSREEFLGLVWEQKTRSRGNIIGQLKRLGCSCDFSREAFTMGGAPGDPLAGTGQQNFHDAVIRVFVEMYNRGLIYRGKRLVNWDPHFETAISDLEVENVEVDGQMWHFKYPLAGGATYDYVETDEDGTETLRETRDYISIATTRPETMLGDGAVAVHPSDARYAPIVGQLCEIPVGPKEHRRLIPIITDEYPDPNFGSGAVKITGAHDFNDYGVAKRNGIPCYRLMDTKGAMRSDGAPYAEAAARAQEIRDGAEASEAEIDALNLVPEAYRGLDRFEARKRVVADISAEGLAVMTRADDPRLGKKKLPEDMDHGTPIPLVEAKKIMQPFGDRSKVVIEPMLTDQWFVDTAKIVQPAIDAVRDGRTRILPEQHAKVYFNWLESIEPWCISRQLWWGHQIPVWYGPAVDEDETPAFGTPTPDGLNHAFCAPDFATAKAQAEAVYENSTVIEAPAGQTNWRMQPDMTAEPITITLEIWRDPDVLDTWFSSGLWPIGTLGWPEETEELARYFPTSTLVTGFDIIFFWVARMMMMQLEIVKEVPFKDVYVHALVRDETGKKMSKSLGNVLDPLDLIDAYGADAVRFTLASMAAMGRDLKLSKDRIAGYGKFANKMWQVGAFVAKHGATPAGTPDPSEMVNQWIMGETHRAFRAVDEALAAYRFNDAANAVYQFFWGVVADRYVEFSKPILETPDHAARDETLATLAWVYDQSMILAHPFMPFITEAIWGRHPREHLLVHAPWPEGGQEHAAADAEIGWMIQVIDAVNSLRGELRVKAKEKIPLLVLENDHQDRLARNWALIARRAGLDQTSPIAALPEGAVAITVPGATFALPLGDLVDLAAERTRLGKGLAKLDKEIGATEGRLGNPGFLAKADPAVVEEMHERLAAQKAERTRLAAVIARL